MLIEINGIEKHVPSDPGMIKLGDFLKWHEEHGRDLDSRLSNIALKEYDDELQREFDIDNHLLEEAVAWYSFWTGFDFSNIKSSSGVNLLEQYLIIRFLLKEAEKKQDTNFPAEIEWNGELWQIQNFVVDPKSEMSFNEIITSKEVMRQLAEIGKGKWNSLLYLSCIFFRKKGESFTDELIHNGSERMELMKELPLDKALMVGFFLSSCVDTWRITSLSLQRIRRR